MSTTKQKKRFSMRNKLLIIFGLLVFAVGFTLAFLGVRTARKAVTEKVETHLKDKATDTAEIIDGRVNAFFQFLEGIARMPILLDETVPYYEKESVLEKEASFNPRLEQLNLYDLSGIRPSKDGKVVSVKDREWFQAAASGKRFASEPLLSRSLNKFVFVFAVPVYDKNQNIGAVLNCTIGAEHLSNDIDDIVVGQTGGCYMLGLTGTTIAHKDFNLIKNQDNLIEKGKADKNLASVSAFLSHALEIDESGSEAKRLPFAAA